MTNINWSKQHNGVIQCEYSYVLRLMPDLKELLETFPDNPNDFIWRGLIRACHKDLGINSKSVNNPFGNKEPLRRHTQVYVDANNFKW